MRNALMPLMGRTIQNSPMLLKVTGKATALMRNMNIKPFTPGRRTREFAVCKEISSLHACRSQIYREKGTGSIPTIIVAGFVPDATEVVEFQRPILRRRGSVYYINYARTGFNLRLFHAQLADLIAHLNVRGEKPVLFGISFGAGLVVDFLRKQTARDVTVGELVLVSPVICTRDLVRSDDERSGGVRMLESNIRRIIKARSSGKADIERQVERARRCFQSLFETGAENRQLTTRHLAIRRKIMDVIEQTTATGGFERLLALQDFTSLAPEKTLFDGPVFVLLAEAEESILVPTSPTMSALRSASDLNRLFPQGTCREVGSGNADDPVTHASLIFHHEQYNAVLDGWYGRQAGTRQAAI